MKFGKVTGIGSLQRNNRTATRPHTPDQPLCVDHYSETMSQFNCVLLTIRRCRGRLFLDVAEIDNFHVRNARRRSCCCYEDTTKSGTDLNVNWLTPRIPRGLFADTSEHIRFYFLVFLFSTF